MPARWPRNGKATSCGSGENKARSPGPERHIGQAGLIPPKDRFGQHKTGALGRKGHRLSSSLVRKYGMYLRPSLYNHIGPIATRAEALKREQALALELRRRRYAVWFN